MVKMRQAAQIKAKSSPTETEKLSTTRTRNEHTSTASQHVQTQQKKNTKLHRSQLPKTKLRGWIHLISTPLSLANSIVLLVFAANGGQAFAAVLYLIAGLVLFGCSATYHIGNWNPRTKAILRRLDHSNIFLLIAGTYTPVSVMLLSPRDATIVLSIIWGGSLIGILMHVFWINSPRWLYVILYILLGWVAIWFLPTFWQNGSPAVVVLLIAGGAAYTIGALFYAFRWPNPWPQYFGFHEFFHLGTVAGYACHAVAIWLALFIIR
ncbi:PAQR family membrane homeostasis protein TrhA [Arcanobacterium hippocoleae]|uniref:PAQR family membrane homeostasis protein TrhA n=1 Tax=Arcanobacterium hippocoleae TaxID=149017 RepID=UPI003342DAFB